MPQALGAWIFLGLAQECASGDGMGRALQGLRLFGGPLWQRTRANTSRFHRFRPMHVDFHFELVPKDCWPGVEEQRIQDFVNLCCQHFKGRPMVFSEKLQCPSNFVRRLQCCQPKYIFDMFDPARPQTRESGSWLEGEAQPYTVRYRTMPAAATPKSEGCNHKTFKSKNKLAAVMVTGQLRTLTSQLEPRDFTSSSGQSSKLYSLSALAQQMRRLGHPRSPNETVATNIQRNLYGRMLASAFGACGAGFDVFMLVETRETALEPVVGDEKVCEPLRPDQTLCPQCELLCAVVPEWPVDEAASVTHSLMSRMYPNRIRSYLTQRQSLARVNHMRHLHMIERAVTYSWIIRLRPDVFFLASPPPIETLQDAVGEDMAAQPVFVAARPPCCGNEDYLVVGRSKIMNYYFEGMTSYNSTVMVHRLLNTWIAIDGLDKSWINKFGDEEFQMHWLDMRGTFLAAHAEIRVSVRRHRQGAAEPSSP